MTNFLVYFICRNAARMKSFYPNSKQRVSEPKRLLAGFIESFKTEHVCEINFVCRMRYMRAYTLMIRRHNYAHVYARVINSILATPPAAAFSVDRSMQFNISPKCR